MCRRLKNNLPVCINEGFRTENTLHSNFDICDAPTLAQAQKWLRGNKSLFVEVNININTGKFFWTIYSLLNKKQKYIIRDYDTYEEALLGGITGCLEYEYK